MSGNPNHGNVHTSVGVSIKKSIFQCIPFALCVCVALDKPLIIYVLRRLHLVVKVQK